MIKNYWYVNLVDSGYTVDDENYEKLRKAMEEDKPVEIVTLTGGTIFLNTNMIVAIEESTAALRDAAYQWNKDVDEDVYDRRRRLGKAIDPDVLGT